MSFAKKKSATPTPTPDGDARAEWRAAKKAQLDATLAGVKKPSTAAPKGDAPAAAAPKEQKEPGKPKARAAKTPKAAKPAKAPKPKKVSCLDAAAQVLAASDKPMKSRELIEAMAAKGLWKSPGGRTPEASLYAAMIREIGAKGSKARFVKHDKGLFIAGKGA